MNLPKTCKKKSDEFNKNNKIPNTRQIIEF